MPAELTRIRKSPSSAACTTAAWICAVSVTSTFAKTPPTSSARASAALLLEVRDDDLRALRGELTDDGGADAGGAAGDECTGSCDVHGSRC